MHSRWLPFVACLLCLAGCRDEPPQVGRYKIPKQATVNAENNVPRPQNGDTAGGGAPARETSGRQSDSGTKDRMLAAMIPLADQAWFFKVSGPTDEVAEHVESFSKLIQSVTFKGDEPSWKLPEGWRQLPGSGLRYATMQFGSPESPLELTVIPLGREPGGETEYVLSNVNRWRDQLGLSPLTAAELTTETQRLEVAGATATLVNLEGKLKATGMAPFANGPFAPGGSGR